MTTCQIWGLSHLADHLHTDRRDLKDTIAQHRVGCRQDFPVNKLVIIQSQAVPVGSLCPDCLARLHKSPLEV